MSYLMTLRPSGVGDETNILIQFPDSGEHWDKLDDDPIHDSGATYLRENTDTQRRDLYEVEDCGLNPATVSILGVRVFGWFAEDPAAGLEIGYIYLKTGGTVYQGAGKMGLPVAYTQLLQTTYAVNPKTGSPWTVAEVDAMQIGISLRCARCTFCGAEVEYEYPPHKPKPPSYGPDPIVF